MDRFWDKVNKTEGCWEWQAYKNEEGYGQFRFEDKIYKAHRVSYTLMKGSIPKGLELDHLCRNTSCVNPLHLEAVTRKEHVRRGSGPGGVLHTPKTHCLRGHERIPENLYSNGTCKICAVEHIKEYRAEHREEISEQKRGYYVKHREEVVERERTYRKANREKINAKKRARRHKENREELGSDIN